MLLKMFSIFDSKVGAYLPPLFFRSNGEAVRAFAAAVADGSTNFCKYPEDYTLFELGAWEDADCSFHPLLTPHPLHKALEFIVKDTKTIPMGIPTSEEVGIV